MLEAYLLDFDGDLYGEEIEVEFIEKLRHDATFADGESLATQMHHDCAQVARPPHHARRRRPHGALSSRARSLRRHWIVRGGVARTPRGMAPGICQ